MFRKLVTSVLIIVVLAGAYAGWQFFTANTAFPQKSNTSTFIPAMLPGPKC